jgi:hypothetical protein
MIEGKSIVLGKEKKQEHNYAMNQIVGNDLRVEKENLAERQG